MDVINGNFVNIGDSLVQSHPETTVQRFSWVTPGNGYAMNSGLTSTGSWSSSEQDLNIKAEDITGRVSDGYIPQIYLTSGARGNKFTVTVNWGDGTEETYESASIYYQNYYYGDTEEHEQYSSSSASSELILFSSMLDDTLRGAIQSDYPTVNGVRRLCDYWYCTSDEERYRGIPNHQYADDNQYTVVVTIEGANITSFRIAGMPNIGWPTLELPYLVSLVYYHLYNRDSIPFSNFTYLSSLTTLTINALYDEISSLPDSIFNMENLERLIIYDMPTTSGHDWWEELDLHRISKLVNLRTLVFRGMYQYYYPEELQDLPLTNVVFGTNSSYSTYPNRITDFSRVSKFTSANSISLTEGETWTGDRSSDSQSRTEIYRNYLGDIEADVSNITYIGLVDNYRSSTYINMEYPEIPDWIANFYSLIAPFTNKQFYGQTQTDTLVERIYEVTIKHPMTSTEDGHRNMWYNATFSPNSATYNNQRPTGTLQAPEGFVEGEDNGNPASPLEMIYVLTHNYGQTWNLMSETSTTSTLSVNPLSVDDKINNVPSNKWILAQNQEGNYMMVAPNTQIVGKLTSLLQFDDETQMQEYIDANNIMVINRNED